MAAKHTQQGRILEWLRNPFKKGLTRREAARELDIYELASRIGELEAKGFRFDRESVKGRNQYLEPYKVTRYRLAFDPHAEAAKRAAATLPGMSGA